MGNLILCRTKEAERPLYIGSMNINLYSLEEICYYIYNNIYLIGMDFIEDGLLEFIRDELEENVLADRLQYLLDEGAGLAEIIVTMLKYVDYYNIGEIEEIREILETLNTQNIFERLKSRADSFLTNKCYFSAIKNYERIIYSQRDYTLPGSFYAKVFHNMGTAYAKMFLYRNAEKCFEEAYKIGQYEESKKCSIAARMLLKKNDVVIDTADKTEEECEAEYVAKREIETLMDNARYSDEFRELESIGSLKEDGMVAEYYKAIEHILEQWKKEYNKYTA